ncbi:MAG: hypothetical protein EZS28_038929, partial [Streblomastix strix]
FCETKFDEFFYRLGNGLHELVLFIFIMSIANLLIGIVLDSIALRKNKKKDSKLVANDNSIQKGYGQLIENNGCTSIPLLTRVHSYDDSQNIHFPNSLIIITTLLYFVVMFWMNSQDNDASLSVDNTKVWKGTQGINVIQRNSPTLKIMIPIQ